MNPEFRPKFFDIIQNGVGKEQFRKDVLSGIIVGIVALPLAIAFAIASGVSPEKGLITAIIGGFIISVLGGSRVQIGGPTGAFIVIVFGIVAEFGVEGLILATFMAGFFLIAMGLARFGALLKFIPYPLIVGFTSGIAVIIFSSQVKDFLGLEMSTVPVGFIEKWTAMGAEINSMNLMAIGLGLGTVVITTQFKRLTTKVPGAIIAILVSSAFVHFFQIPVETIQSKFGEIPNTFPGLALPSIDFHSIKSLIGPALAIALLGAIESMLSAVVADGMIGSRHRPNAELVAQGTANIFSALLGGIPATGAIARTATNVKNGGRTPIAGITHALILLLIMLVLAPYATLIPMATLAGILMVVAYNMSEFQHFKKLLKSASGDILILLSTFILTVLFDLVIAIEVGLVLSSFIVVKRMSESMRISPFTSVKLDIGKAEVLFEDELKSIPKDVLLYEINGPLFFGAAQQFQDALSNINAVPRAVVIRMRHVPFIDATGINSLKEVIQNFRKKEIVVVISGASAELKTSFLKSSLHDVIPIENIQPDINASLDRVSEILKK
jgi:SulP family sulfate permease